MYTNSRHLRLSVGIDATRIGQEAPNLVSTRNSGNKSHLIQLPTSIDSKFLLPFIRLSTRLRLLYLHFRQSSKLQDRGQLNCRLFRHPRLILSRASSLWTPGPRISSFNHTRTRFTTRRSNINQESVITASYQYQRPGQRSKFRSPSIGSSRSRHTDVSWTLSFLARHRTSPTRHNASEYPSQDILGRHQTGFPACDHDFMFLHAHLGFETGAAQSQGTFCLIRKGRDVHAGKGYI
jgi:hypothetical protein